MLVSVLSGSVTVSKLVFYAQSTGTVIPLSGQKCDCETDSVTDFAVLICDFYSFKGLGSCLIQHSE